MASPLDDAVKVIIELLESNLDASENAVPYKDVYAKFKELHPSGFPPGTEVTKTKLKGVWQRVRSQDASVGQKKKEF